MKKKKKIVIEEIIEETTTIEVSQLCGKPGDEVYKECVNCGATMYVDQDWCWNCKQKQS